MLTHLRDNFFFYIIFIFTLWIMVLSYDRFFIEQDYLVGYEGVCDPFSESCFVGCLDEECSEEYYYSLVKKHAKNLYEFCGNDVTDCENASVCLPGETECYIEYCTPDSAQGSCEHLQNQEENPVEIQDLELNQEEIPI